MRRNGQNALSKTQQGAFIGEWVLILALNITNSTPGEIRDVSHSMMRDFGSKVSCEAAAQTLAAARSL